LTPQAFSYPTVYENKIYIPPYGLDAVVDYMLVYDTVTNTFEKIQLDVDNSTEKWQKGIVIRDLIYFLPYNESKILIVDPKTNNVTYLETFNDKGKWLCPHVYKNTIIALPYGEHNNFDWAIILDTETNTRTYINIATPDDEKKWHTTQLLGNKIIGVPRGEDFNNYFPYGIEFNCDTFEYELTNLDEHWQDYNSEKMTNKKFTTLANSNGVLYAPPYSENPNFDVMLKYDGKWSSMRTGIKGTSRKYYSHTVAKNGVIYFPPAGHDEDWSEMLVILNNGEYFTKDLGIGKESKKYFAGLENSQNKIYYIPRGGCVCEPVDTWKSQGDLAEVLVIDTMTNETYTIDVGEYFTDNTTIEKYNQCVIINDIIYAFPYGESNAFQTVLVFDTINEKVIRTIDLNGI
jgi:hypothetical protein